MRLFLSVFFFAVPCAVSSFLWARRRAEGEGKSCRPPLSSPHVPMLYCSLHFIHVAHHYTVSKKKKGTSPEPSLSEAYLEARWFRGDHGARKEWVDEVRFETSVKNFVFCLQKPETWTARRRVALMIMTCPQDYETIPPCVSHIVRTLEGQSCFEEVVLANDRRR